MAWIFSGTALLSHSLNLAVINIGGGIEVAGQEVKFLILFNPSLCTMFLSHPSFSAY